MARLYLTVVLAVALTVALTAVLAGCSSLMPLHLSQFQKETAEVLRAQILDRPAGAAFDVDHHDKRSSSLLDLSDQSIAVLEARINPEWSSLRKMRALRSYLYEADELHIRFSPNQTKTAEETFTSRSGNCISLTSLFIAAARHFGLDAHYQTVKVKPSWDQTGITMIRYEHIIATGRLGGNRYIMDFLPNFTLDGLSSKRISDAQASALYYNNLGVEQLIAGDILAARDYLQRSLAINQDSTDAWNNLGAVFARLAQYQFAEFSYAEALRFDRLNYSALGNLVSLYKSQGRIEEQQALALKVERYRKRNPYYYLYLARQSYHRGDFEAAQKQLKRAIRLKRDEPEFHQALAVVNSAEVWAAKQKTKQAPNSGS